MADTKITALTAITSITPATFPLPIVDLLDTTMAGSGTTKKVTVNQILGCGGTATLASATITGDLTVDTNVLKVDTTNDRVGIRTATPANTLEVVAPAGDNIVSTFRSGDATAANNAGGGFRSISSATAASRVAQVWLDADGANFSGGDYFYIQKNGNSGTVEFNQSSNAAMTFLTNSTERMRIDSSGNVGIGVTPSAWRTSVPFKALQIGYTGAVYALGATEQVNLSSNYLQDTGGNEVRIQAGYATRYQQSSGSHIWSTAGTSTAGSGITFSQAMTLDASGRLLIGTTTATTGINLKIAGGGIYASNTTSISSGSNTLEDRGSAPNTVRLYNSTDSNNATDRFVICDAGASVVRAEIRSNGGLANYQANDANLSDERTKTDIKPLASYWNKIKALEVVTFKYKDQAHSDNNIGLIAQQVETVAPELVDVDGFGETPADGVPLKTIYTTDLYHGAIKALQEAMTRIEALEAKLA